MPLRSPARRRRSEPEHPAASDRMGLRDPCPSRSVTAPVLSPLFVVARGHLSRSPAPNVEQLCALVLRSLHEAYRARSGAVDIRHATVGYEPFKVMSS